jgi:hypothetical protein
MSVSAPIRWFRRSPQELVDDAQQRSCTDCIFIRRFETFTCALDDTKTGVALTRCAEFDDLL